MSIVYRKFGSSKRFGEGDKKDIMDLLAVKIHLKNEEWQRRIQATEDKLTSLQNTLNRRETTALETSRIVRDFVREHEKRLKTHAHGLITTSDTVTGMRTNSDNTTLTDLKASISKVLFRMDQMITQREALLTEKSKCFQTLKIKDEQQRLDQAIHDVISIYSQQMKQLKQQLASNVDPEKAGDPPANQSEPDDADVLDLMAAKDDAIATLKARLAEVELESASRGRQVSELRAELDDTRTEMISLRRNNRTLTSSVEALKQRLQVEQRSVRFSDTATTATAAAAGATTVSVVELNKLPSIGKKKCSSAKGGRKLPRRPSTVH